jgi:hypothetical protein
MIIEAMGTKSMVYFGAMSVGLQRKGERLIALGEARKDISVLLAIPIILLSNLCFKVGYLCFKVTFNLNQRKLRRLGRYDLAMEFDGLCARLSRPAEVYQRLSKIGGGL